MGTPITDRLKRKKLKHSLIALLVLYVGICVMMAGVFVVEGTVGIALMITGIIIMAGPVLWLYWYFPDIFGWEKKERE